VPEFTSPTVSTGAESTVASVVPALETASTEPTPTAQPTLSQVTPTASTSASAVVEGTPAASTSASAVVGLRVENKFFPLTTFPALIGRNKNPHARIDVNLFEFGMAVKTVSRRHCQINKKEDGTYTLENLGRNGTRLNDTVVKETPASIEIGSILYFGSLTATFTTE